VKGSEPAAGCDAVEGPDRSGDTAVVVGHFEDRLVEAEFRVTGQVVLLDRA
jgi:hypothetical protein